MKLVNPVINAIASNNFERALEEAKHADDLMATLDSDEKRSDVGHLTLAMSQLLFFSCQRRSLFLEFLSPAKTICKWKG
jgi:hypothetical protein